jgi:hypothetical protein
MNYQEYYALFDDILNKKNVNPPYDKESYYNYTKLNITRMRRWDKQALTDDALVNAVKAIKHKQHWIIISEPWCGDAAHVIPFMMKLLALNNLITYEIQLRDSKPFLIQSYLTNGSKSIPKLVVRDEQGNDLFTWGPRPKPAQALFYQLKASKASADEQKIQLQNWYNADKGATFCREMLELYKSL